MGIIRSEEQKNDQREQNLRDLWDTTSWTNIHIVWESKWNGFLFGRILWARGGVLERLEKIKNQGEVLWDQNIAGGS